MTAAESIRALRARGAAGAGTLRAQAPSSGAVSPCRRASSHCAGVAQQRLGYQVDLSQLFTCYNMCVMATTTKRIHSNKRDESEGCISDGLYDAAAMRPYCQLLRTQVAGE